ncbi:hypothetical protein ACFYVL_04175 [Streptomyces sp. NPDC004111]|uniref:hypothetical protein n=1 Tax=Streptomyces sp. NPDC004111 TaxID=3364690 RepID=UPI0036BAB52B
MTLTLGSPAGRGTPAAPERLLYYPQQRIHADDLNDEQAYHRRKLREHNRFLHGWGVVCGFDVQPAATGAAPWRIRITPGHLLTPQGDSVTLRADVLYDVADCLLSSADPCVFARPCPPVNRRALVDDTLHLAVRYTECETRPVHRAPAGCSCAGSGDCADRCAPDAAGCQYTRVLEAHEICCLPALPRSHAAGPRDCDEVRHPAVPGVTPCPPCTDEPWVVLATLTLPRSPRSPLDAIDLLRHRRLLPSAAHLADLARCPQERP